MSKKGDNWIYGNNYPEYEELFKRIEAALGFELFTWQKSYIVTGRFRQYGETTATILKELLDKEAEPLDYTRRYISRRQDFYRREIREIQERLKEAGIKTRVVFWCAEDKKKYAESYNKNKQESSDGECEGERDQKGIPQ